MSETDWIKQVKRKDLKESLEGVMQMNGGLIAQLRK